MLLQAALLAPQLPLQVLPDMRAPASVGRTLQLCLGCPCLNLCLSPNLEGIAAAVIKERYAVHCYLKHKMWSSLACTPINSAKARWNAIGTDCQADLCQGCIGGLACQGLGKLFQGAGPCEHLLRLQSRRNVQAERWELLLACSNTLAAVRTS